MNSTRKRSRPARPIDDFTVEEFRELLDLNLVSIFAACKLALPHLRRTKGNIINMSSLVGTMGQIHATTYVATKGAITAFTKALAIDEAEHGVRVALEFLPWTGLSDLATGWELVRTAGRPNAGLDVDAWHYFRGRPDAELLRSIPPEHINCVQLDDADPPLGSPDEDTMMRRRLPGEGELDLVGLVRVLDEIGVDIGYSVEILSTEFQSLPVAEAARRSYESTRRVLETARS